MDKPKHDWGDYYYQGRRKNKKAKFVLDMIHSLNQSIPTFNELFDEETFYVFAGFFVIFAVLMAIFLAKCVGVKIKEHDIEFHREWRGLEVANAFKFPWQNNDTKKAEKKLKSD